MVSLIVENVTTQQHPMLIQTTDSSEDSFDALQPSLSTIRIKTSFEDRRLLFMNLSSLSSSSPPLLAS
ncbi:hypothetical protein A2U01_0092879 [Trifolium medium]|uniref:Uncharacterized protein n=1 Tax=Trifolium medium TaxID=97028 RepID=A0A392UGQ7_9FABA|nr:hypothetical protein [Trifolium medium]